MDKLDAQLSKDGENKNILDVSKKMEKRTDTNYPIANEKAKIILKEDNMQVAEKNENVYLSLQNKRV